MTAVEFGLIAMPFFVLTAAVFEAGLVTLAQQTLNDGLDRAARQVFTGRFQENSNGSDPTGRLKKILCDGVIYIDCSKISVEVTTSTKFGSSSASDPYDSKSGEMSSDFGKKFSCPGGNDIVTIRAAAVVPRFFNVITLAKRVSSGGQLVVSTSIFRAEPYTAGTC